MKRTLLLGTEDYLNPLSSGQNYPVLDLADYDFIEIVASTRNDISAGSVWNFKFDVQTLLENKNNFIWLWAKRWLSFQIAVYDNQFYFVITGYGCGSEQAAYYTPIVYKVYGYRIEHTVMNEYLPNSDEENVICSAVYTDYNTGAQSWGKGSTPVILNNTGATINTTDNCVSIPGSSYASIANVTGALNTGWTVYFVMRGGTTYSDGDRYFNTGGWNANQDMIAVCINRQLNMGAWTTDTATGVPADVFFVVGVSFYRTGDPYISGAGKMMVYDPSEGECKVAFDDNIYLSTANLYWGYNPGSYSSSCDMDVKFIGLVNTAESQATIEANIEHLYNEFLANS